MRRVSRRSDISISLRAAMVAGLLSVGLFLQAPALVSAQTAAAPAGSVTGSVLGATTPSGDSLSSGTFGTVQATVPAALPLAGDGSALDQSLPIGALATLFLAAGGLVLVARRGAGRA